MRRYLVRWRIGGNVLEKSGYKTRRQAVAWGVVNCKGATWNVFPYSVADPAGQDATTAEGEPTNLPAPTDQSDTPCDRP